MQQTGIYFIPLVTKIIADLFNTGEHTDHVPDGEEAMTNLIDKTLFWLKVNEDTILNFLAYVVAPLLVIVLLSWVSFS
jgi:hypothetical protein